MVPSFGGIELLDSESKFASGAAFILDRRSRGDGSVTVGGIRYEVRRDGRVVVARGGNDSTYEGSLDSALRHVQEALDLWSFPGVDDLAVTGVQDDHLAWWPTRTGLTVRVLSISETGIRIRGHATVTNANGNAVELAAHPAPTWHPSFRYFRLSQASGDLFDSYRNAFLALESLLSDIAPPRLGPIGRPVEREKEWFHRALTATSHLIPLSAYAHPGTNDPLESILQDLFAETRSATFHAKAGRPIFLPRDATDGDRVLASLGRLVPLYLALARAHLGVARPNSSLSTTAFREMAAAELRDMVIWVSPNEVPLGPDEMTFVPGDDAVQLPEQHAVDSQVPFVTTKLAAGSSADFPALPFVRTVAGTSLDRRPRFGYLLEGRLVLGSAERLEVVLGERNRNEGPRVHFPT